MPSFQANLTEQALPTNPRRLSSGYSGSSDSGDFNPAAGIIKGVGQVAAAGLQTFLEGEARDKKTASVEAAQRGRLAAADIQAEYNQRLIPASERAWKLRLRRTQLIQESSAADAGFALTGFNEATNTVADVQDQNDYEVNYTLGLTTRVNKDEAEWVTADRGALTAEINGRIAAQQTRLKSSAAKDVRDLARQEKEANKQALNIASLASPIIEASLHLVDSVSTEEDLKRLMGSVTSDIKAFEEESMLTLNGLMGEAGLALAPQNAAREQLAAHLKPLVNIFDSEKGIKGIKATTDFLKAVTANTELNMIEAAPLVSRLSALLGPTGIGHLASSIVSGDTVVQKALLGEIETIMRDNNTFSEGNVNDAFTISKFLLSHSNPERAAEYASSHEARSAGVNLAVGIVNNSRLDATSTETDIQTFSRQAAVGLVIGDKAVAPGNRDKLLDANTSASFAKNLDYIKKVNPDLAGRLERSISRYAASSIDKGLRRERNEFVKFNPQEGQFVWEPAETRFSKDTDPSAVAQAKRDSAAGARGVLGTEPTAEDHATVLHLNKALLAIVDNTSDKGLKEMTETQRTELVVQVTAAIQGNRSILTSGASYRAEGKAPTAEQKAAVSSLLKPTARDIKRDSVKSVFDRTADKLDDALDVAEQRLRRIRIGADGKVIK